MDHQNFNIPIQNPNFQLHRIWPGMKILTSQNMCCIVYFMKFQYRLNFSPFRLVALSSSPLKSFQFHLIRPIRLHSLQ
ncbi:hypothetical protein HZ326_25905 [Fusarium oxysporum f. sp. albedinis]|nr:hypothetical protein HZ326_25905 [Fusarium oxysporum f. sp. albedinis]